MFRLRRFWSNENPSLKQYYFNRRRKLERRRTKDIELEVDNIDFVVPGSVDKIYGMILGVHRMFDMRKHASRLAPQSRYDWLEKYFGQTKCYH